MCGAVSGGIMAISLYLGRDDPNDPKDLCYETIRAFLGKFASEYGEVNCFKLTGIHLGTVEGQALFRETEQKKKCTDYVGAATQLVLELVEEEN
jgi:C_GCAxxG_C_C family probable redox protein